MPNKFVERILERAGYVRQEKAAIPSVSSSSSVDPFTIWARTKKIDPAKALEVYTGWVYAAIRAIAMDISGMESRLFRRGKEADEELFEHEILDLLGAPNDYEIGLAIKYVTAAHLEACGNAYWYMEGVETDADRPIALHAMIPSKVKVIVNRDEFPTRIQKYRYTLGARTYEFKPEQVIHFKYPDPSDPFEGIGTVQSIAQWIDADNYATEFNRRFFLNGARIGGFLESESAYTPEQLEYLKSSFEAAFKGVENAYKVLALPKGTKYEEGGKTQKDMDFANLSTMMRDHIIAGFKVPRTALGITDDVNRANAEATDYVFAARTIKPIMKFLTSYLNEFLVPRYGEDLYLDFKDPVPEDRAAKVGELTKATGGAPWVSVNEARDQEGLEPVEGGDAVMVPFNLTPLGAPAPTGAPAKSKQTFSIKTRFAVNAARRREVSRTVAERTAKAVSDIFKKDAEIKKQGCKSIVALTDDEYEAVWKAFAARVDPYEKKERDAVRHFNKKQRAEVIGNLPKITKTFVEAEVKAVRKDDLFDYEEDMAAFVDLTKPIAHELASKEGAEAAKLLGLGELDILTPAVRRALDRSVELLSDSYNSTTRDLLKSKLEQGLKEGLSQDELADLVNGVYDYSDEVRAETVARTETFRIANYATQEAWKQSGIVKSQKWYTAADERVCPYCAKMHGKVISIDEDFAKKGDTVTGEDGTKLEITYSDVGAPPLHASCRCFIRPENITLE